MMDYNEPPIDHTPYFRTARSQSQVGSLIRYIRVTSTTVRPVKES